MNSEPDAVDVEGLVKALEKVLGLPHRQPGPLTGHEYLLARDVVWAFTDGRSTGRKPTTGRTPTCKDLQEPARICKCPTEPTTLLGSMRKGVIAVRFIGSCALPTRGGQ
jgi:hypothetical protein